jgi:hypothetical protein
MSKVVDLHYLEILPLFTSLPEVWVCVHMQMCTENVVTSYPNAFSLEQEIKPKTRWSVIEEFKNNFLEGYAEFPSTIEALHDRARLRDVLLLIHEQSEQKNNGCRSECTHLQEVFLSINNTNRVHVSWVQRSCLLKNLNFFINLFILLVKITGVYFVVAYAYLTPQGCLLCPWHIPYSTYIFRLKV